MTSTQVVKISAGIGYGLLLEGREISILHNHLAKTLPKEEILKFTSGTNEFNPDNPLGYVQDVDEVYSHYFNQKFPLLEIYSFGTKTEPDGYAVFAFESQRYLTKNGKFFPPAMPYSEALAQLARFKEQFAPGHVIGWQQWVSDSSI